MKAAWVQKRGIVLPCQQPDRMCVRPCLYMQLAVGVLPNWLC